VPLGRALVTLITYELKRAVARKRVILLVALIFLVEGGLYLVITRLPPSFTSLFQGYAWIVGVLVPSSLLIHVLALTIGASAFSEEYEMGTVDFWLTKPISRMEYFMGKVAGSLVFTALIVATYNSLALVISATVYGPQQRLDLLIPASLVTIFSSLPFLFIGLCAGELLRRSMFATIFASIGFFASLIVGFYISIVVLLTGDQALGGAVRLLPTWGAVNLLPTFILNEVPQLRIVPAPASSPITTSVDIWEVSLNVALYSAVFCLLTILRLTKSDITRRGT